MSPAWWLAHCCMLGLVATSQTTQNMLRTKKYDMTSHINLLARTTGSNPVPEWKVSTGYSYVKDKFGHAKLTPQESDLVDLLEYSNACSNGG
ncbi:hypothetical protein LARI1_G007533 [Lachnellula arida]|uniref:Uncharacterized protein n=1 Tax=Lachnellula arida TaxID=1316785 RepID=A0A8T9B329_9HELO|nr:hypothetical protein LARI1_G007533 [Lachnellula arida]